MGRTKEKKKFKINKSHKKGICRMNENGKNCTKKTHCRDLCSKHHTYMLRWDLIEKYGVKQKFVYVEQSEYKINKAAKSNKCRIIENEKACKRNVHGRGLCARHWLAFERHGLLKKYGSTSRKDPRVFSIKKKIVEGVCRINENYKGCNKSSTSRGLCSKHYLRFLRNGRIDKFGKKCLR